MSIHPMAIVADGAQLHPSVEVGPFTIVENGAIIGEGTVIGSGVHIHGYTTIGTHNEISDNAILGALPQSIGFESDTESFLLIGNHNVLKENVNISRSEVSGGTTRLGNNNYIMCNVHLGHDCNLADNIIIASSSALGGHVKVDDRAFISGVVSIHQFCRIGSLAMVAASSRIVKDIPPFATVDGNPASLVGNNVVGLRRSGYNAAQRADIKRCYKTLFRSGLNTTQALEKLKSAEQSDEVKLIITFFEQSQRGVTAHR